jgi:hypothetical protein
VRTARRWQGGWAVIALVALSACQAPKPAAVPPVAETPPATGSASGTASGAAADPATAALPPEPIINDDPQQLMGIGPGALSAVLGEPELIRREAPAEIWQYRNDGCVLDVFLYDTAGRRTVTYIEARDGTAQRIETRACLNTLLRARLARPLG